MLPGADVIASLDALKKRSDLQMASCERGDRDLLGLGQANALAFFLFAFLRPLFEICNFDGRWTFAEKVKVAHSLSASGRKIQIGP